MDWVETPLDASGDWSYYGAPDPQVIVAGHSHSLCMLQAMQSGDAPRDRPSGVIFTSTQNGLSLPEREYWDSVAHRAAGTALAIAWRGNQHAQFVIDVDVPLRLATVQDDDEAGQAIPEEVFREVWRPSFDELRVYLTRMRSVSRLYVLGTPAPKSSEACLMLLEQEDFFKDFVTLMNIPLDKVRIVPTAVRLRLWTILQDMTREIAEANGAIFVPSPPQSVGADGLLLEEFYGRDLSHANAAYGALMWAELDAVLDRQRVSA